MDQLKKTGKHAVDINKHWQLPLHIGNIYFLLTCKQCDQKKIANCL